jgi:nucleotide-binding universal stress UspA family protein
MLQLQRILLPTDFSPLADVALDTALKVAEKHRATLHMLHAVVLHADDPNDPAHHFPDAEEVRQRLEEIAESRMSSRLEEREATDIEVVRAQRRGISAAPTILEYAEEVDADLVVMSTHGRRGLGHALLGSVTEEVVRLSRAPVLTIRGHSGDVPVPPLTDVLVPVDFSAHARQAVSHAKEICAAYGARLNVLHVFERPIHPEIYIGDATLDFPGFKAVEGNVREALDAFASEAPGPEAELTVHLREGHAVTGILELASELECGLLVIATHGLTGVAHMLLGSVTEKVVRRATCPVLTVKAFGKSLVA